MYILLLSLFAPLPYLSHLLPESITSAFASLPGLNMTGNASSAIASAATAEQTILLDTSLVFPHHSFATYLASLLSLLIATFLGFMDDVFDIRWRFKLPIPSELRVVSHLGASLNPRRPARSHRFSATVGHLRCRSRRNRYRAASHLWSAGAVRRRGEGRSASPR